MAKTGAGLAAYCEKILAEGVPYFYGAKMEVVTKQKYNELKSAYPSMIPAGDEKKIGRKCCDCSGLISAYTGVLRGSQGYRDTAKTVHSIATVKDAPVGALVWKQGHIGVYVGVQNNIPIYIAQDGSKEGCRKRALPANFTHWFLCSDIEYGEPQLSANSGNCKQSSAIAVGDTVTISDGAVYGGLYEKTRGLIVPASVVGRRLTVGKIATHKGEAEALLTEINSWVAVKWLIKG